VTGFATTAAGTALSGLSGAAANSALLAWLGGGSLAAGGFGVAGGTLVLGGIAVAPALAVAGFVVARKGEQERTKAVAYAAEVDMKLANLGALAALLERVGARVDELAHVLEALDARAAAAVERLWALAVAFDAAQDAHVLRFASAMRLVKAESELLRVPLVGAGGDVSAALVAMLQKAQQLAAEEA
jgi:hypothetical protein